MPKSAIVLLIVFAIGLAGLAGVLVVDSVVPYCSGYRPRHTQCANQLRQIAMAALLHRERSGGHHFAHSPDGSLASLELLANQEGFADPRLFVCPSARETALEAVDGSVNLTEDACSYEMAPWRLAPTDTGAILVHDKRPHHGGGRLVALTDASVEFLPEDDFQRLYEDQRKRFVSR